MTLLSLDQANRIASAALAKGRELGLKPLCVAVLDRGAHLVVLQRDDGASNLRPQIAIGKATGALGLGVSSRVIGEMAVDRPTFVASLASLVEGGLVPAAGGILIDANGEIAGAIGVTGDTSENDEICAYAGLEAGVRDFDKGADS